MTVDLLTYANRAKVAEALTQRGYEVTRMTVNRWARGGEMPGIAQRLILELFGHNPDATKEALRPEWAEGLATRTDIEGLATRVQSEAARQVTDALGGFETLLAEFGRRLAQPEPLDGGAPQESSARTDADRR